MFMMAPPPSRSPFLPTFSPTLKTPRVLSKVVDASQNTNTAASSAYVVGSVRNGNVIAASPSSSCLRRSQRLVPPRTSKSEALLSASSPPAITTTKPIATPLLSAFSSSSSSIESVSFTATTSTVLAAAPDLPMTTIAALSLPRKPKIYTAKKRKLSVMMTEK